MSDTLMILQMEDYIFGKRGAFPYEEKKKPGYHFYFLNAVYGGIFFKPASVKAFPRACRATGWPDLIL